MCDCIIRFAEYRDLPELTDLYNYYVVHTSVTFDLQPYTVEERSAWFFEHSPKGKHKLIVAEHPDSGRVLGFACSSSFRPKAAYSTSVESSIYIYPKHTRKTIGTKLYQRLFSLLEQEHIHRVYACITVPNPPSQRLHEYFGFAAVGLFSESGYKLGAYRDIMWMEKKMDKESPVSD
ncbi:MAG: N-acetyltransferase family protein [Spirochaetota bacterium]